MHDQTADREEEGMSDGRGRRRRKHTHPFFMPFAAAETGGKKTRRSEEDEGKDLKTNLGFFFFFLVRLLNVTCKARWRVCHFQDLICLFIYFLFHVGHSCCFKVLLLTSHPSRQLHKHILAFYDLKVITDCPEELKP